MNITFEKASQLKEKPEGALAFGKYYTDYMFIMDWSKEMAWHDARIVPYQNLSLDPASMVFHYAQETFEGLKAYRTPEGNVQLFRPEMNAKRFANSNKRLCMPEIPESMFLSAIEALVAVEKDWVPGSEGQSLYIRPFCYASQASVGAHPSLQYKFVIILSPVGAYYAGGLQPVKIYVEDEFTRASPGGTGFAKCGGNYAGAFAAQEKANALGYDQVLWLDGVEKKYVEEVGAMNVMFLIEEKVLTAPIKGTVLPGVTRDSIIHLLKESGYEVLERQLSIDELMTAAKDGRLKEAWGTGTAAVVSPIGELYYQGQKVIVSDNKIGPLTQNLYNTLTDIQWGKTKDIYKWTYPIPHVSRLNFEVESR